MIEAVRARLEQSLSDLEWAVAQVPDDRFRVEPPGEWSAARVLAHMVVYEETIAAPLIEALAEGRDASTVAVGETADTLREAELQSCDEPSPALLARLRSARRRQVDALERYTDASVAVPVKTGWGMKSPAWVLDKTFEHTWEHGTSILRIALFWPLG